MIKLVGLTGGIGSGKSTVAQIIREQGMPVIDADAIARDACSRKSALARIRSRRGAVPSDRFQ